MKQIRRLIIAASAFIGVWVFVSFGGAMLDSSNAAFWSSSLMWSILSALVAMPALLMVYHASSLTTDESSSDEGSRPQEEQEPFIQERRNERRTLWPEPEQQTETASNEESPEGSRPRP